MCGRTAVTIRREQIAKACAYKKKGDKKYSTPKWKEGSCLGKQYVPSTNVAPTDITPVIVQVGEERSLEPMMWGMVPPWHKGSFKSHGLSTNNCRIETATTSKLYGEALRKGTRCVILADGFYEWQTKDGSKKPYFIYLPQNENIKIYETIDGDDSFNEENGWNGVKLLKMAGLYSIWQGDEGELKSYSVITLESNETMDWIHHRMPAILETEEQVAKWLDVENVPFKDALACLKPATKLESHRVSVIVNNSRNKSQNCNKPIDKDEKEPSTMQKRKRPTPKNIGSQKMMMSWLGQGNTPKKRKEE